MDRARGWPGCEQHRQQGVPGEQAARRTLQGRAGHSLCKSLCSSWDQTRSRLSPYSRTSKAPGWEEPRCGLKPLTAAKGQCAVPRAAVTGAYCWASGSLPCRQFLGKLLYQHLRASWGFCQLGLGTIQGLGEGQSCSEMFQFLFAQMSEEVTPGNSARRNGTWPSSGGSYHSANCCPRGMGPRAASSCSVPGEAANPILHARILSVGS